jgi:hypothetical protein
MDRAREQPNVKPIRLATALVVLLGTASTSLADGFDLVIPARPGVPVIINGIDASYAVVEGDFGLGKGVHRQPTIYGGRYVDSEPYVGHYYPSLGSQPGYGRMEIEPPAGRKLPKPAESYHESWGAQSMMQPPQPAVPMEPPAVLLAPRGSGPVGYGR